MITTTRRAELSEEDKLTVHRAPCTEQRAEALRDRVGAMEVAEAQAELARAAAQLRSIEKLRQLRKGG